MDTPDTQKVLQALETCLREVSSEAVSSDDQIVLHGLGPSPVSFNHRDITVLRLHSDGSKTVIDGDVNFQASALLGEFSQDGVVRTKLERVFEKVKLELKQETAKPAAAREKLVPVVSSTLGNTTKSAASTAAVLPAKADEADEAGETAADGFAEAAPKWDDSPAPLLWPHQRHRELEPEDGPPSHRWMWTAVTVALLLILAGAAMFFLRERGVSFFVVSRPQPVATRPEAGSVAPKRVQPELRDDTSSAVETAPSEPVRDPAVWLEEWAAAMRSHDAAAQAGFYAETVDQYLGRREVSREAVLKDRDATIRMRKGLWTMKMEDVRIERQTDSEVEVHLLKHFIDQPAPGEVLESYVPTRLTLKRMDGSWRITSEQDLATASPAARGQGIPVPGTR